MKKLKSKALELLKDESGQGTAEYVLILVGIVGAAIMFRRQLIGDGSKQWIIGPSCWESNSQN